MSMNYELAKKLKDAGFPQGGEGHYRFLYGQAGYNRDAGPNPVYAPTLSELIEACGRAFEKLEYTPEVNMNPWWAHEKKVGPHNVGDGIDPEEAVANLWLALNTHY